MAITPSQWSHYVTIPESYTPSAATSGQALVITDAVIAKLSAGDQTTFWSNVENGGGDVRICTASDGTGQLPVEVVSLDNVAETCVIWTRKATYDGLGDLYLFIGKSGETQPAVTDPFGRNAVWQDYLFVSHDGITDSSGNTTPIASNVTAGDVTALGESARFNGSNSRVDFTLPSAPSATATWYIQAIAKTVNTSANKTVFGIADGDVSGDQDRLVLSNDQANVSDFNGTGSNMGGTVAGITSFNHYGYYLNQAVGPNARLFLNGSELSSDFAASGDATAFDRVSLGVTADSTPLWWFDGDIQEARATYDIPSDDYIATEYANQSSPATFYGTPTIQSTSAGATYSLTLGPGTYTYTGSAVTLQAARNITLDAGSYVYTGSAQTLAANRKLALDSASYAYTGQDVTLKASRIIAFDAGTYAYTGEAVALTHNPSTGATYSIALDAGAYTLTGQDVSLTASRKLALDPASYSLTGSAVTLRAARSLSVESGAFVVTGNAVALSANRSITLEQGAYALTGSPVTLSYSGEVIALISGYSVNYKQDDVSGGYANDYIQARFQ